MLLSERINQCWTRIVAGSTQITTQEKQMLEAFFYLGALTTVGILNNKKYNLEEDLARLELSYMKMNEKIQGSVEQIQYH